MSDFDASDRADVREAEKMAKAAARADDDVLRGVMRTIAGRAWMFRKLAACHVHQSTFTGDALQSAFREGERNIGLQFEADLLRVCPDEYILMMRESNERSITLDTIRNNRRARTEPADDFANFVDYTADNGSGDSAVERTE